MSQQVTISPVDNKPFVTIPLATSEQVEEVIKRSKDAFLSWKKVPVKERAIIVSKFVDAFVAKREEIAKELTMQMGRFVMWKGINRSKYFEADKSALSLINKRPIRYTGNEVIGTAERARYMISIAEESLKDVEIVDSDKPEFRRFIRKEPLGRFSMQSSQTPLCAERFAEAFKEAGLPENVFQVLHASHSETEKVVRHPDIAFVNFTGSVEGGREIQKAATTGLELGGKDPAYVRPDADLDYTVEQLVDGSFFNSGQCCCAIERIYVHEQVYENFLKNFVDLTKGYKLGNPLQPDVTLGPMVRTKAAEFVRGQIEEAVKQGAKPLIDVALFPEDKVSSDEEAIRLMNDSEFGLTASIWTKDEDAALRIGNEIDTGTWFMNRCDCKKKNCYTSIGKH
ncbi:10190_t:CDS:2 [Acaulospora colombiana]|uniref:10190_t:CDS:1 n=1 Tax=Acaulospora colombiana TaxID=27376 RepID=A0ACA9M1P9_9GLOM|nr:10190_t:CDS:2 [Acaulospora colombiana]